MGPEESNRRDGRLGAQPVPSGSVAIDSENRPCCAGSRGLTRSSSEGMMNGRRDVSDNWQKVSDQAITSFAAE